MVAVFKETNPNTDMKEIIQTPAGTVRPGTRIRIISVKAATSLTASGVDDQALRLNGRTGTVRRIDDAGNLWGDWDSLAVLPDADTFEIIPATC